MHMEKTEHPLLIWDTCQIIKDLVENHKIDNPDDERDEDELWAMYSQDACIFEFEWDCLCDTLTEKMKEILDDRHNMYWYVKVENFGWRGQDGHAEFCANDGRELLQNILPENTECTFKIYGYGENAFAMTNAHHDSPVLGQEWYYIYPVSCPLEGNEGEVVRDEDLAEFLCQTIQELDQNDFAKVINETTKLKVEPLNSDGLNNHMYMITEVEKGDDQVESKVS